VLKTDIAYAAGVFDGEGTITLAKNKSSKFRKLVVGITNTSLEIVTFFKSKFGGMIHCQKRYKANHSKCYLWRLSSRTALPFLKLIVGHIKDLTKKQRID
jgi:hypothetical protein